MPPATSRRDRRPKRASSPVFQVAKALDSIADGWASMRSTTSVLSSIGNHAPDGRPAHADRSGTCFGIRSVRTSPCRARRRRRSWSSPGTRSWSSPGTRARGQAALYTPKPGPSTRRDRLAGRAAGAPKLSARARPPALGGRYSRARWAPNDRARVQLPETTKRMWRKRTGIEPAETTVEQPPPVLKTGPRTSRERTSVRG